MRWMGMWASAREHHEDDLHANGYSLVASKSKYSSTRFVIGRPGIRGRRILHHDLYVSSFTITTISKPPHGHPYYCFFYIHQVLLILMSHPLSGTIQTEEWEKHISGGICTTM